MIVRTAVGVLARLTQGLTTMSSSQLRTTKLPGPKAIEGSLAIVGVVSSVHKMAHVVFSVQASLSVTCR